MFYQKITFPTKKDRLFFYTNFVQTLDGKVAVKKEGYWPIGSKKDYQVLLELRAYADCLIHGGNLGREFGEITLKNLNKKSFKDLRMRLGRGPILPYYIITSKPESIIKSEGANVFHLEGGGLQSLVGHLKERGYLKALVEGGPTLLGSFLKENLLDEIFLTIAPKIFGNESSSTLTLVEGYLFPPKATKKLKLLSVKQIGDELFLRYEVMR